MRRVVLWATALVLSAVVFTGVAVRPVLAQNPENSITVQTVPGQTVSEKVVQRLHDSWPWYIVRGSGIIAAITLTLLMLSGIGQITGHTFRFLEPLTAWASHRALGIVCAVTVLLHMGGLLFDHFLPFSLLQILVPWTSSYKPVSLFGVNMGSLYVALGVLGFYLLIAIVVTSLVWIQKKPKTWKLLHIASYALMAMVFVHALYIGTDTGKGIIRVVWIACAVFVALAGIARMRRIATT